MTTDRTTPRHSITTSLSSSSSSSSSLTTAAARLSFDSASPPAPSSSSVATPCPIKPHRSSSDLSYSALSLSLRRRPLSFRDFRLLRRIGSGDTGTVFLCSLADSSSTSSNPSQGGLHYYYAMKVVDRYEAERKKKTDRVETERRVLRMVDHPFLPTLYAEFEVSSRFSCIMMEYCEGGDLHVLRHHLPNRRFPLSSARFYAAEVLLALEYLHMLGIIYRDLKPENVLIRSDGNIMLSDFDLSLFSDAVPAVESPSTSHPHPDPPAQPPFSCLPIPSPIRILRSRKIRSHHAAANGRLFIAEPVTARSLSFVGTHEYVSPEVASGKPHGSAVDWWALGIFLYEMVYGRTPFAGASNKQTLHNIIELPLRFPGGTCPPETAAFEAHARDLISGLLCKDPERRLGSRRGAADIKKHPFFKGLNFALIRSVKPPEIPRSRRPCPSSSASYCQGQVTTTRFDYF